MSENFAILITYNGLPHRLDVVHGDRKTALAEYQKLKNEFENPTISHSLEFSVSFWEPAQIQKNPNMLMVTGF